MGRFYKAAEQIGAMGFSRLFLRHERSKYLAKDDKKEVPLLRSIHDRNKS